MKEFKLYSSIDISDYYGYDLTKTKQIQKLARFVANTSRKFPEYKVWAKIKKQGYTKCPKCGKEPEIAPPEVHHEPETLFEICYNFIEELIRNNEILNYTPIELVKEILYKHLNDQVSSITICKFCHEEIHNLRKLAGEISDE